MLDAALARVGRLGGGDGNRHVAGEWDAESFRFGGDREIGIAWKVAVDLDEIGALSLLFADDLARLAEPKLALGTLGGIVVIDEVQRSSVTPSPRMPTRRRLPPFS